uniref:Short-chain dehydrogenase reductase SDR domain containing protein n=1 Tax=Haemonchus contortus TaxID=6289 RepID=W6NWI2_HAECO
MGQFDGRAVIVTGSSNGMGRTTAVKFAKEGAMVTICGRDEKTLNETKSMVLAVNGGDEKKVFPVLGDICKVDVMKDIVDGTVNAFGRLDVLVNNAGGSNSGDWKKPEIEGDMSNFEYTLNLNTKSILRLCQLAYPHLIESKGDIVNVSSIAGQPNGSSIASPYYSISKAAQDQLTRNLAICYIQKGVRVNGVSPGMVSTNMVQRKGVPAEVVRKMEEAVAASPSRIPCGRSGTPEEIAEAILFLADRQKSGYIVGHLLVIDGGSSLQMPVLADGFRISNEVLSSFAQQKA